MTQQEAQARALRAAGRVTLTLSLFGCIEEVPEPTRDQAEADAGTDAEAIAVEADAGEPLPDAALFVDALAEADPDAEVVPADAEPSATTDGALADGGVVCDLTQPDWAACCEANNWNPDAGCLAWGPPVPPALA